MRRNSDMVTLKDGGSATLSLDVSVRAPHGSLLVVVLHPLERDSKSISLFEGTASPSTQYGSWAMTSTSFVCLYHPLLMLTSLLQHSR